MNNAIILHGKPNRESADIPGFRPSAFHWLPWLRGELMSRAIHAVTPDVPNAWVPDYAAWQQEFERHPVNATTLLVGHSCGGGFILRWLSEHTEVRVARVLLVAPWLDPAREETTDFFDFAIDPTLSRRTDGVVVFVSDDDHASIHASVAIIMKSLVGTGLREFVGRGHFCTDEFPELLSEALA